MTGTYPFDFAEYSTEPDGRFVQPQTAHLALDKLYVVQQVLERLFVCFRNVLRDEEILYHRCGMSFHDRKLSKPARHTSSPSRTCSRAPR